MTLEHSTEITHRAAKILSQLSIEEKVSLLSRKTTWRTAAIPAHDVPGIKVCESSAFFGTHFSLYKAHRWTKWGTWREYI
jgi:hypothetical protein